MIDFKTIFEQRRRNRLADRITMPQAFTAKFPDMRPDKAEVLFQRYLGTVMGVLLTKLPHLRDGETFVSLDKLINGCRDFQYKGKRYWVWNEFKDLFPFMIVLNRGSNLRATSNPFEKNTKVKITNERWLNMLIENQTPKEVFEHLYDLNDLLHKNLEELPIDMDNLRRFIGCTEIDLERATDPRHVAKLQNSLWQAMMILKVGQYTEETVGNALLPLIPSPSAYGRVYYKGLSIQNVNKQVRGAIIGRHVQYDMNAAVFAIKLRLYGDISGGDNELVGTTRGSWTRQYLAEKDTIRSRLARECYQGVNLPHDAALRNIKNALTAIGFGARTSGRTWYGKDGREGTALTKILASPVARERFLADTWVKDFLAEQRVIEDAILGAAEKDENHHEMCAVVRAGNGANGKVTRAGKLAYIYQHWETILMDEAVAVLAQHGVPVIARIHDAFLVRDKLPVRVLDDIAEAWGFRSYLSLAPEPQREWIAPEFKRAAIAADANLAEHRVHIERAQQQAALYAFRRRQAGAA